MEQSFMRPSLSSVFTDPREENHFLIKKITSLESIIQDWRVKFEEVQNTNNSLFDKLAEEKEKNQLLTNELAEEQSANKSLNDELYEEQSALQYFADKLKKEKTNLKNISYDLSKEKSVSYRLRLERIVYMMCFSVGAFSLLMYDWYSKLN